MHVGRGACAVAPVEGDLVEVGQVLRAVAQPALAPRFAVDELVC